MYLLAYFNHILISEVSSLHIHCNLDISGFRFFSVNHWKPRICCSFALIVAFNCLIISYHLVLFTGLQRFACTETQLRLAQWPEPDFSVWVDFEPKKCRKNFAESLTDRVVVSLVILQTLRTLYADLFATVVHLSRSFVRVMHRSTPFSSIRP